MQDELAAFRGGAAFYEVMFDADARLEREGPLLRDALARAPGNRVADLACGTGPHALYLAGQGAQVAASDLSAEMVTYAREHRAHPNVTYSRADMRDAAGGPWDLALCLGNSMSLLPDRDAVRQLLEHVRGNLAPGGLFLVQVLNYAAAPAQEPRHRVVRKPHAGAQVVAVKSLVPGHGHTLLSLAFFAFQKDQHTSLAESAVLLHLMREDLAAMADAARLRTVAIWGGFDQAPFIAENAPDLICLFERPKEID